MQPTPAIAIHMTAALAAVALGPIALWARLGPSQRPRMHRAAGYAWVTLMVITAVSALFIHSELGPQFAGFGPIHLFIPVTLGMLTLSFYFLLRGNVQGHRKTMQRTYFGACVLAGAFALAPGRLMGHWLWSQLGLI